jgi:hypothetical protein
MGKQNESGSAFLFAILVIALLAIITEGLFYRNRSGGDAAGIALQKQKMDYLNEGLAQVASQFAQDYFSIDKAPTTAALNAYVAAQMASLDISGYAVQNLAPGGASTLNLTMSGGTLISQVPSGPFVGMDSYQVPVQIDIRLVHQAGTLQSAVTKNSVLAKVGLFEFSLFGDQAGATTYLAPDLAMDVPGRVHVNGDFCLGNNGSAAVPLRIGKITASGAVKNLREATCWTAGIATANDTLVATDQSFTLFASLDPGAGDGCVNCNLSGMDWKAFAISTWRGNLLDVAHGVAPFKLPVGGLDRVQDGVRADLTGIPNGGSMRVLVDPVLSVDPSAVAEQKFAFKSDIRIINGVWYLKNPASPSSWPGVPIWSDHPGRFISTNEEGIEGITAIGQEDIRSFWSASLNAWTPNLTPSRFSYYEYDPVNHQIFADNRGVVSYGTLFRDPAGPTWRPGQWARANSTELCDATFQCTNCNDTIPLDAMAAASITCSGGNQPIFGDFVLNGTRSGFNDGNVAYASAGGGATQISRSHVLPMNFDVQAFRDALNDPTPGELGSFFGAGRFMGRPFNGVIYVTNTWPGSMNGVGGGQAQDYPFQSAQGDALEPLAAHAAAQQALPFALCSAAPADLAGGLAGSAYDGTTATRFVVPNCKRYSPGYIAPDRIDARPNVLRIINASTVDAAVFAQGLTLATNLPAYIVGDTNTSSDTSSVAAAPWVPTLLASDQLTLLSNGWDDANSHWDVATGSIVKTGTNTTYNVSIFAGSAATTSTTWNGGLENLPRYIERWLVGATTQTAKVRGSIVMGFNSVYARNPVGPTTPIIAWGDKTFVEPARDFAFDPHLDKWLNQPAGAPSFDIYAVQRWILQ